MVIKASAFSTAENVKLLGLYPLRKAYVKEVSCGVMGPHILVVLSVLCGSKEVIIWLWDPQLIHVTLAFTF